MFEILKSEASALRHQTLFLKEKERHYLNNARYVSGKYSKKHQKDELRPEMSEHQVQICLRYGLDSNTAIRDYEKYWNIAHSRKNVVRKMARDVHLALAFLRGTHPLAVERTKKENPNWRRIEGLVVEFGEEDERILLQRLAEWKDAGNYPPVGKKKLEEDERIDKLLKTLKPN